MARGSRRTNGFDENSRNSNRPLLMPPITPSTRATKLSGKRRLNSATNSDQPASISVQSSIDPSWPPQTAAMR